MFKLCLNKLTKANLINKFKKRNISKISFESFENGINTIYIEQMYKLWKEDKKNVHSSWDAYFTNLENGLEIGECVIPSPALYPSIQQLFTLNINKGQIQDGFRENSAKLLLLVRAFQKNGYYFSNVDPLELGHDPYYVKIYGINNIRSTLDYKSYGFTENDLDKKFYIHTEKLKGILSIDHPLCLREVLTTMEKAYLNTIGVQFLHLHGRDECNFFREKFEKEWINYTLTPENKKTIYEYLAKAVMFEDFLQNKFSTQKRFGIEGLETLVSGLMGYVKYSVEHGVGEITMGLSHRGRLNILANVLNKPISKIFAEFSNKKMNEDNLFISGDIKYHLGTFYESVYPTGKRINIDVLPNPSHLESINPVVYGKTKAKQEFTYDVLKKNNIAILVHGDCSFTGQGIVYETGVMGNYHHYNIGGCLHVIVNNQIGFTTSAHEARSTLFCADVGKALDCPILHVNADDPIAVDFSFRIAAEYRDLFKKDIIIDLIGYRRYGHNELDEPHFTQPLMYSAINKTPSVLSKFEEELLKNGEITIDNINEIKSKIRDDLLNSYDESTISTFEKAEWLPKMLTSSKRYSAPQDTGIKTARLHTLARRVFNLPEQYNFPLHIRRIYKKRFDTIYQGEDIGWATAEALAFASLLDEGFIIRLSGENVEQGNHFERFASLIDTDNNIKYKPLSIAARSPDYFYLNSTSLSSSAGIGFELGYSYYNPDVLCIWESFYNDSASAQIFIDQFISSGENKWNVETGLVLIYPHGYDCSEYDVANSRVERFLQLIDDHPLDLSVLCVDDTVMQIQNCNLQVCCPTFPANYFHLLRRQMKRSFRKPLILLSPRPKLINHKITESVLEEFCENTRFVKVRLETNMTVLKNPKPIRKILICCGQIYLDLDDYRKKHKIYDVAVITLEQIGPFPYVEFLDAIRHFDQAKLCWVQEEPMNQGCWEYIQHRINNLLKHINRENFGLIEYVGRKPSAVFDSCDFDYIKENEKICLKAFS